jgi:mono/diheme cytochrome c family protein
MKKIVKVSLTTVSAVLIFGLFSFVSFQAKPWPVPAGDNTKVSPVKSSPATIEEGKTLYVKNCQSCHGKSGLGDGPKAKLLESSAGDFSAKAFQSQTDGSIFFKTEKGRGDMPAYKGKIEETDIWKIIVFMRTFKK